MKKKIIVSKKGPVEAILALGPALSGLRSVHPNAEIYLETDESNFEAASIIPELDGFGKHGGGPSEPDIFFNLDLKAERRGAESVDWLCYSQVASTLRLGNPYHAIDLARKAMGIDTVDANFELAKYEFPDSEIFEIVENAKGLKIAICAATLNSEDLEALLLALKEVPVFCDVFFLGTIKDRKVTGAMNSIYENVRVHDLCGRLSLKDMSQLLFACDVSVCGPGTTALLSSGHGTFTICLDKVPERGPIYYPYGHGHLIIQSQRQGSFPAEFSDLLSNILKFTLIGNDGMLPTIPQWQEYFDASLDRHLGKVRVCATQRVEAPLENQTSLTEFHLKPMVYLGAEYHDAMQVFYRLLWEMSLSGRSIDSNELEILHQDTIPALCELLKPLEQIYELGRFGATYCDEIAKSLSQGNLDRAKQDSERLQEVDDLIRSIGSAFGGLQSICEFHLLRQGHLTESNPISLAKMMKKSYSDLQSQVLVLLDLKQTLFHTNLREGSSLLSGNEEGMSNG